MKVLSLTETDLRGSLFDITLTLSASKGVAMPELPEVETIKRGLSERIVGKTIKDIEIGALRLFSGDPKDIIGWKITDVERRAKVLRVKLNNGRNLLFHLKMTGQLIWRSHNTYHISRSKKDSFAGGHPTRDWAAELPNAFTRITFIFDDDSKLFFNDMRMFGWCKVLSDSEVKKIFDQDYGHEPFSDDFTVEYLKSRASKIPNRKIKQFITDQKIIAGIGNIYADESLFLAGISPFRRTKEISAEEWSRLRQSIRDILKTAIRYGGTTEENYVDAEGKKGGMQDHLNVYGKQGQSCPICGGDIIKTTLGGRGTHYCPKCQK